MALLSARFDHVVLPSEPRGRLLMAAGCEGRLTVIEERLSDVLGEFARTMVTDFPIQAILDRLVERIVDVLPITAAGVTLISPGVHPRYVAASNDSALRFEELQTELGEGPCLLAYHSDVAVEVPDLRGEERFPTFTPRALAAGMSAVFTFPLRHGDRRLGALDLYRDTPGELSAEAMAAAQTLADVAAAYLLNAQARASLQDSSDRSREASLHDPLTGLANRVLLWELLEHALLRARRSGRTLAVIFVDLDRFKTVNDTYGHRIGDELLVAVAQRLTGLLRPGDPVARLSGDEFVVLCEDLATRDQATAVGARLDVGLARPFVLSTVTVEVGASIGIAFADRDDPSAEELLHDADTAMYRTKHRGRAGLHVLDLGAEDGVDHQGRLIRDLPGVLERSELHLEYQPIVDTADRHIGGVEALLRWDHPSHGKVAPSTLIPLAEQSGLIPAIGYWVLEQACEDRDRWVQPGQRDDLGMSVNVSAHQLMTAGFAAGVAATLERTGTDPQLVTLELTESVFVRDAERALLVLKDLKDLGVLLALDDFGTGYSSLSYLKGFPVDIVKIDQAFVADIATDPASRIIVAAVVALAHDLGMSVVAEGVETAEQYRDIAALGCDACQGYYFARPMTADKLDALVNHDDGITYIRLPVPAEALA